MVTPSSDVVLWETNFGNVKLKAVGHLFYIKLKAFYETDLTTYDFAQFGLSEYVFT